MRKLIIRPTGQSGFTFLELVVVVAILSILVTIVMARYVGQTDEARQTKAKAQIRNLETALKLYKVDNGFYPSTEQGLDALVAAPTSGRTPKKFRKGGYLEESKVPLDPWNNEYTYISPGLHNDYDIISYGADGVEGGTDYDQDIQSWNMTE